MLWKKKKGEESGMFQEEATVIAISHTGNILMCLGNYMESSVNGEDRAKGERGQRASQGLGPANPSMPGKDVYCKCVGKARRTFKLGNYK